MPDCRRVLTAEGSPPDRTVVLGEMAHIVAERPHAPRGNSPLPLVERNRAENLILLCNNHHQLIDSQPQTYTVERMPVHVYGAPCDQEERDVQGQLGRLRNGEKKSTGKARPYWYHAEVQFWRDYLSESQPRILLRFGHVRQTIVISTTLMRGDVTWPGIPKEHAKPFKNVEYVDDLFSWAEFRSLEAGLEEAEEDEWLMEDETEGDDEPH